MITAEQILDKAIENWRTKGWLHLRTYDENTGAACLVGGINQAFTELYGFKSEDERRRVIYVVANLCNPERPRLEHTNQARAVDSIVVWNDKPGRTAEEALTLAEQARAELKRDADSTTQ